MNANLDRKALVLIAACSLTYFLDCLIPALLGALAAPMAATLGLDRPQLGAVFSAGLVGQCVGLVAVPLFARRAGHRRIVICMTLGFGLAELATSMATSREALVAARLVSGLFLGGALPSGLAMVTQGTPPRRRGLATMLLFTAYGLGGAVAGFFAGFFVEGTQWRGAFAFTGGACLLAVIALWRWLREPGLEHEPDAGAAAAAGGRLRDIVTPPLLGGTLLLWFMFIAALTIYYCLSSWLPTLLVDSGRSPRLAAYAVGTYTAGGVISGLLMGPLIDRFGATRTLAPCFVLAAMLLFAIGQLMHSLADAPLLVLLATCGFFMLGAYGGLNVVLAGHYPAALRAVGVGWTKSVSRFGTVLPPLAIGHALALGVAPRTLVSLFAVPAVLVAVALVLHARGAFARRPAPPASQPAPVR